MSSTRIITMLSQIFEGPCPLYQGINPVTLTYKLSFQVSFKITSYVISPFHFHLLLVLNSPLLRFFSICPPNRVKTKSKQCFLQTIPWVRHKQFPKKTQVHVNLLPLVFFIVGPKAVDPKSFPGDPIRVILPFHLLYDYDPHILLFVSFLLEVVCWFCAVIPP